MNYPNNPNPVVPTDPTTGLPVAPAVEIAPLVPSTTQTIVDPETGVPSGGAALEPQPTFPDGSLIPTPEPSPQAPVELAPSSPSPQPDTSTALPTSTPATTGSTPPTSSASDTPTNQPEASSAIPSQTAQASVSQPASGGSESAQGSPGSNEPAPGVWGSPPPTHDFGDSASTPQFLSYPQNGVCVDGVVYRGKDDNDVLTGFFCEVINGEHTGRYGVYIGTATCDQDGWPITVTVKTRDAREDYLTVDYADIRPAQAGRR